MNREERKTLTLVSASHGLVHLFEGAIPPLIPLLMGVFDTNYFSLGIVITVFSYAFGLGSLPAGMFVDRIGPLRLISGYLFLAGLASLFVLPVRSLLAYGIVMTILGIAASVFHPAANTLITRSIEERGAAYGINGIAGSLGVAVVPLVSAWLGTRLGWQAPHIVFGTAAVAGGFYSLTLYRRSADGVDRNRPAAADDRETENAGLFALLLFFVIAALLGLGYKGVMTFLPTFMGERVFAAGTVDRVALGGAVATVSLLSGTIGQYVSGRLVDRRNPVLIYAGAALGGAVFLFLMAFSAGPILIVWGVLFALFNFSIQPAQAYLLSILLPAKRHGTGYGILFFSVFGVGSMSAAISGFIADRLGLGAVFAAMGGLFAVGFLLLVVLAVRERTGAARGVDAQERA